MTGIVGLFTHLQIAHPAERWLVGLADVMLSVLAAPGRLRKRGPRGPANRVLLFRLERVGDLLMAKPAMEALRNLLPHARLDLVVGSWNRPLAALIPAIDRVYVLDLPWLARGETPTTFADARAAVRAWRAQRYDLAVNFEGDIRSHALMWATGARRRVGFDMAGGGPLLTDRVRYDPRSHVTANCLRLVARACDRTDEEAAYAPALLQIPEAIQAQAARLLNLGPAASAANAGALIGIHVGAGRLVKQWMPAEFSRAAAELARRHGAAVVLTGTDADRPLVDEVKAGLPADVPIIDLVGQLDLLQLSAVFQRVHLVLSVDTGPMHVAAAVGTPVLGVFGPSDPRRWGPLGPSAWSVRVELPCSPCNRIRRPPARCVGHIPDCLMGVSARQVVDAAEELMREHRGGWDDHGSR